SGDGKPDFEYNIVTGEMRFRPDGASFQTTGGANSFVSSLLITSDSGILKPGGASAAMQNTAGFTGDPTLISGAIPNTPGFTDGFDMGTILAPFLSSPLLTNDLTVKYQVLNGGSLR